MDFLLFIDCHLIITVAHLTNQIIYYEASILLLDFRKTNIDQVLMKFIVAHISDSIGRVFFSYY